MKILLITDHFPPEQSGASGRTSSLFKYLPENGIFPDIITIRYDHDKSSEKGIFRYSSFIGCTKKPWTLRFWQKILPKLKSYFGLNIDSYWQKNVLKDFDNFIKEEYRAVYASYPSVTALLLGSQISTKLQIPLISEYRDGMCFEPIEKITKQRSQAFQEFEKKVIMQSQAIITISEVLTDYFKGFYNINYVYTVRNGFDPTDFLNLVNKKSTINIKKRFVHFGSVGLSRDRSLENLFISLHTLKSENIIQSQNFELSLIGNYSKNEVNLLNRYDLADCVNFRAAMPRRDGLKLISKDYDYLLFYGMPNSKTVVSAKLPEYLALNKPIIGICQGNEAASIIQETCTGNVCDFSVESIKACFIKFMENRNSYQPDIDKINRFNRQNQTAQIAGIIQEVIKNGR